MPKTLGKWKENTLFVEYGFLIAGRLRPLGRGRWFFLEQCMRDER
jgi:hypothetical protein